MELFDFYITLRYLLNVDKNNCLVHFITQITKYSTIFFL